MDGEGENGTDALFDAGSGFGFIGQPVQDADDGRRLNLADSFADNIANALNPSYKSSMNIAQMRKDWRKCRMKK